MFDAALRFIRNHEGLLLIIGVCSLALFLLTLILVPFIVVNLPADYFSRSRKQTTQNLSPVLLVLRIMKNVFGVVFLILGLLLLVLPGPGWLTILTGFALTDFPFKRKLELYILSLPAVRATINKYRKKHDKEPLQFP